MLSNIVTSLLLVWNSHLKIYPGQNGIDLLNYNVSKVKKQWKTALPVKSWKNWTENPVNDLD